MKDNTEAINDILNVWMTPSKQEKYLSELADILNRYVEDLVINARLEEVEEHHCGCVMAQEFIR